MTDAEYNARVLHIEHTVEKTSFLCDRTCDSDFWRHAAELAAVLVDLLDAHFYGVEPTPYQSEGLCSSFDARVRSEIKNFKP